MRTEAARELAALPPAVRRAPALACFEPLDGEPGSETATVWSGYMEGTPQAGERVASEVLESGRTVG
jgi:hypothetical protein